MAVEAGMNWKIGIEKLIRFTEMSWLSVTQCQCRATAIYHSCRHSKFNPDLPAIQIFAMQLGVI